MGLKSTYISQKLRREIPVIQGFSKLTKEDKIKK